MSDTIFHLNSEGRLIELNEARYISEDLLQQLLAQYPNLLAGSQIDSNRPRRWLLVDREFGVPDQEEASNRWSLDHLFIDQVGVPTLVEVKRSTDTRIRREVIGQILDYASNAVTYWSIDEIKFRFEEQCRACGKSPQSEIDNLLQTESDADSFWERVKTNLKAGKIRMLIVADTIPKELQRIIEFLNEQMSPAEILGVEIKQFISRDDQKTLVPRVIGKTINAEAVKGKPASQSAKWNEETFFTVLSEQRGTDEVTAARAIYEWARPYAERTWFGEGKKGSLAPVFKNSAGQSTTFFALITDGSVEIQFQHFKSPFADADSRIQLLQMLNQIDGLDISEDRLNGRPNFPISLLSDNENRQKFFQIMHYYLQEIGAIEKQHLSK